jgi:hypothetical protein
MPNYDPDHAGNALLVLLVYDEFPIEFLSVEGHFFARKEKVFSFVPDDPHAHPVEADQFKFDNFRRMAEAAKRALAPHDTEDMEVREGPQNRQRPLVYLGMQQRSGTENLTSQPDTTEESSVSMLFGYGPSGTSILEGFATQDSDLLDGVVTYDPQPAVTTPCGTSFTLTSCQYPAGFLDEPVAFRTYERILERLDGTKRKPRFSLFVGDQVYVDPTAGLYDPSAEDDHYRLPYEAWLRQQNVRNVLRRMPSFMLLDDHEIDDNWEPVAVPDEQANDRKKTDGVKAYKKYQRGRNGGYETFDFDGFNFFMLDTRTERMHRKVDASLTNANLFESDAADPSKTMGRLKQWLLDKKTPKFVVSPAMLLPRHRRAVQRDPRLSPHNLSALHSDSWDGYPKTLRELLVFIATNRIRDVVFLSGDEHRACVAKAELYDESGTLVTRVHSIHTAAAYAPYPFANGLDEDTIDNETIDIVDDAGSFQCVVSAMRPPLGDGTTFLSLRYDKGVWQLDYEFADGVLRTLTI